MASLWKRVKALEKGLYGFEREVKLLFNLNDNTRYSECDGCGGLFNKVNLKQCDTGRVSFKDNIDYYCVNCRPNYDRIRYASVYAPNPKPKYFKMIEIEVDVNGNPVNKDSQTTQEDK